MNSKHINTYKSLTDERFSGTKEELLERIDQKIKSPEIKAWNKSRLRSLRERVTSHL